MVEIYKDSLRGGQGEVVLLRYRIAEQMRRVTAIRAVLSASTRAAPVPVALYWSVAPPAARVYQVPKLQKLDHSICLRASGF